MESEFGFRCCEISFVSICGDGNFVFRGFVLISFFVFSYELC